MKTSDGRNFAHEGMAKSWQGHVDRNPGAAMKPQMGGEQDRGEDENVVAEHGPAHTSHIMKNEKDGSYSVHSHHKDGHIHKSHGHAGAHEAHQHSMKMHGASEENERQPDTEVDDSEMDRSESGMTA